MKIGGRDMDVVETKLDSEELLHLALRASKNEDIESAIGYLKSATAQSPNDARAIYLLGALHAEIGLYQRAIDELLHAIELDPNLHTAQLQLGMLYMTLGQSHEAMEAWAYLDRLDQNNPLHLFKQGLECLTRNELDQCVEYIGKGLSINGDNSALNRDMESVFTKVKNVLLDSAEESRNQDTDFPPVDGEKHILLSAYRESEQK
jgi:tetratricopeptide (TPR) repeat protein